MSLNAENLNEPSRESDPVFYNGMLIVSHIKRVTYNRVDPMAHLMMYRGDD